MDKNVTELKKFVERKSTDTARAVEAGNIEAAVESHLRHLAAMSLLSALSETAPDAKQEGRE